MLLKKIGWEIGGEKTRKSVLFFFFLFRILPNQPKKASNN
jgi:hypothetical protein